MSNLLPRGRVAVKRHKRKRKNGASVIRYHLRDKWPRVKKGGGKAYLIAYKKRIMKEITNLNTSGDNISFDHRQFMTRRLAQVNKEIIRLSKKKK